MDTKKKLALFEKYDFSKSAILRREGLDEESPEAERHHGFGAILQAIAIELGVIKDGECDDVDEFHEVQNRIWAHYQWLQSRYNEIDWDEMDHDDPDLSLFFEMKERIDRLGNLMDTFLRESREHLCKKQEPRAYKEIQDLMKDIRELLQGFKAAKKRLEKQG